MMSTQANPLQDPLISKYLLKLERQLKVLPKSEQEDCLNELKSQIYDQIQNGENPEQILNRLGKARDYARPFVQDYFDEVQSSGKVQDHLRLVWEQALLPALAVMLAWVSLMQANTIYIFAELMSKAEASFLQILQMVLLNMPAIIVVSLPIVVLWTVPVYVTRIAQRSPSQALRKPKIWAIVLMIGFSASLTGFVLQEFVVPASNRSTVNLIKDLMQQKRQAAGNTKPLVFSETLDVRQMNAKDSYDYINGKANSLQVQRDLLDYYTKFSLPLLSLSTALFGLLTASLMLSRLFHPIYTLIVVGFLTPTALGYGLITMSAALVKKGELSGLYGAFLPNIILAGIALLFLMGLLFPQKPSETAM